jgi:epoxyqueuosine reductase QueG
MNKDKWGGVDTPEEYIRGRIEAFVSQDPGNCLRVFGDTPMFDAPLVRFADGYDPLFQEYKSIIGPFHLTPREALEHALGEQPEAAHRELETISVICWVLPIAKETRLSNRHRSRGPSKRWAHTRAYGQPFKHTLRDHVVTLLRSAGYLAIAPVRSSLFEVYNEGFDNSPISTWSERHVLYVAGMGTFGLSDGFITPKGIAMRCASVVTNLALQPSERPYDFHYANCPFLVDGSCGKCIDRCPAGAITTKGHDKKRCQEYIRQELHHLGIEYGAQPYGCGLCQTGVPCEAGIPERNGCSCA